MVGSLGAGVIMLRLLEGAVCYRFIMKQDIGSLFRAAIERTPEEQLTTVIKDDLIAALQDFNVQVPENLALSFTETKDGIVLTSDQEHLDPLYEALAYQSAVNTLKREIQVQSLSSGIRFPSLKKHSKIAEVAFYLINGLFLFGSLSWLFSAIVSPNFSEWFFSEMVRAGEVLVTLVFLFLLPAVLLATTLGYYVSSRMKRTEVSLKSVVRSFEIGALLLVWIAQTFIVNAPMTDELRLFLTGLLVLLLVGWYAKTFRLSFSSLRGVVFHHIALSISVTTVGFLLLTIYVPMFLILLSELDIVDFISDALSAISFNPWALIMLVFWLAIILVALVIPPVVVSRSLRQLKASIGRLDAARDHLGTKITVAVVILFIAGMYGFSRTPSVGVYGESLILLAQSDSTYELLSSRAASLVGKKEKVDELLEGEMSYYEQYLFDRRDIERFSENHSSLLGLYLSLVWYPFIDWEERGSWETRKAYQEGYERAYGVPYGHSTSAAAEVRQVQHLSRDILVSTAASDIVAQVTITDSFSTFMNRDQEVVLEFSLPEEAVVTDLRLGPALQYRGQIAPRGAAEQTYVEQVWKQVDPALLEQVGPRQYRLRVYPVPAANEVAQQRRVEEVEGEVQRVQFTYYVLRDSAGIPLPHYSAARNVLSGETKYTVQINGESKRLTDDRLYVVDPRSTAELCAVDKTLKLRLLGVDQTEIKLGQSALSTDCEPAGSTFGIAQGKRIQFMVDTSYDNREGGLDSALQQLRELPTSFYENNTVTLTLYNSVATVAKTLSRPEDVPQATDLIFFSHSSLPVLANAITANTEAVVILSGTRNPFAEDSSLPSQQFSNKIITVVHEGAVPTYGPNVESSLAKIRSLTVHTNVDEALEVALLQLGLVTQKGVMVGDYWSIETDVLRGVPIYTASVDVRTTSSTDWVFVPPLESVVAIPEYQNASSSEEKMFEKLAVRADIKRHMKKLTPPNQLHSFAVVTGIVSPLSSYIALVNEQQQVRLNQLSTGEKSFTNELDFRVAQPRMQNPLSPSGGIFSTSIGLDSSSGGFASVPTGNTARSSSPDASIKQSLGNARAQAELIYNQDGYSYEAVCENQSMQKLMEAAQKNRKETTEVIASDTVASGFSSVTCHDSTMGYAIVAPLTQDNENGRAQAWCVDSTGFAGQVDLGALDASGTDVGCTNDQFVDPETIAQPKETLLDRTGGGLPVIIIVVLLLLLGGSSWWLLRFMKRNVEREGTPTVPPSQVS